MIDGKIGKFYILRSDWMSRKQVIVRDYTKDQWNYSSFRDQRIDQKSSLPKIPFSEDWIGLKICPIPMSSC